MTHTDQLLGLMGDYPQAFWATTGQSLEASGEATGLAQMAEDPQQVAETESANSGAVSNPAVRNPEPEAAMTAIPAPSPPAPVANSNRATLGSADSSPHSQTMVLDAPVDAAPHLPDPQPVDGSSLTPVDAAKWGTTAPLSSVGLVTDSNLVEPPAETNPGHDAASQSLTNTLEAPTPAPLPVTETESRDDAAVEASRSSVVVPSKDYNQALQRHIPTLTWGQIEVYLTYGTQGLRSIWITVGKSGTEVQSLCEAITRLINLLLAHQVPIATICRQIRGIRGADSEGLGPHRVLGLADLIGKALQEAPEFYPPASGTGDAANRKVTQVPLGEGTGPSDEHDGNSRQTQSVAAARRAELPQEPMQLEVTDGARGANSGNGMEVLPSTDTAAGLAGRSERVDAVSPVQAALADHSPILSTSPAWSIPDNSSLTAMLCPECGAELQQMNGCSGGACPVCGFSSCS